MVLLKVGVVARCVGYYLEVRCFNEKLILRKGYYLDFKEVWNGVLQTRWNLTSPFFHSTRLKNVFVKEPQIAIFVSKAPPPNK